MSEEAKAVQEVAKTAAKAIDATSGLARFFAKFVSGPAEQASGILEDRLRFFRQEQSNRLQQRTERLMKEAGMEAPTRDIPMNLAVSILQKATLEENDSLQERWAALLVNAANASFEGEVPRSFPSILEQLSPIDAQILDVLYQQPYELALHMGIATLDLPSSARVMGEDEREQPSPSDAVVLSLSNLARLGCIRPSYTWGGGESFGRVNPTVAGRSFVRACQVKKK
jgi:hypothetical protein